jgi:hypothetical protein
MARGRWYPTATMLTSGEILVMAGSDQNGNTVMIPEVRRDNGTWRELTSASRSLPYYPRDFLAPNGSVFYAGELQGTYYLNTTGTGSWTFVANRVVADRSYGAAVMYRPGKILYVGGGRPSDQYGGGHRPQHCLHRSGTQPPRWRTHAGNST